MATVEERVLLAQGLWSSERQLVSVYERLLELAAGTDCLEESTELLELQRQEIHDIKALIAALQIDASTTYEAVTSPGTFDAILEFLRTAETDILENYYLKLDQYVVDPVARQIVNRATAKQVRQIRLLRRCIERRMKRPAPPGAPAPPAARIEYVVQPGDTLFLIARRHGLTLEEILRANPQITNPQLIMPGEVVFIPARVAPAPPPGMFRRYVVQPGDTMFLIARKFGISLQELVRANPGVDPDLILPGQVINVPSPTGAVG